MRFHTAVNRFCLDVSLNKDINVYKTALNQFRPYLFDDAFKLFKFTIIDFQKRYIMLCLKIVMNDIKQDKDNYILTFL